MSVWKSPIFYFGIVLLAVLVSALSAPFIVNWNGYRDNLEAYGRKLTGREVAINGPISVRLFPWPRLVTEDVSIANPKGFEGSPTLNARSINAELALAGLFAGEIRVESITLDHPVMSVVRNSDGAGNWNFRPDQVLQDSKLLDQVKLERITILDGELRIQDKVHGYGSTVKALNAILSASVLEGPWRVQGTAAVNDFSFDLNFSSSIWRANEPFHFGLKLDPQDAAFPAFAFEGQEFFGAISGKMNLTPAVSEDGRQSLDIPFAPLQMQADVKVNFETLALDKIHIVPADAKDSGTLIEGTASVTLQDGMKAEVNLNSPRLDLDNLAGSQSLRLWRAGGAMGVLNTVIKGLPERLDLTAIVNIATLSEADEALENVQLTARAQQDVIRIQNFTADLPGRSRMKFNGIVFPGDTAAEMGGSLAIESNDTRKFVSWMWPEAKTQISKIWTGSRGRLKAQSDVTWSGNRFGLQNLKYELDAQAGKAELAVRMGKLPAVDLNLQAEIFDLDNYVSGEALRLSAIVPLLQTDNGVEKRFSFQSRKLRMNTVEAENVVFDFASNTSGFEVKKFDLGSVEGAHVQGQGLVLQGPDGPTGDIKLAVAATNPHGLLRLLGFAAGPWNSVLGQTDLQASVSIKPGATQPLVTFDVIGQTGPLHISVTGDVKDVAKGLAGTLGLSSEITTSDSADLFRLFGITPATSGSAGKIVLTAAGSNDAGFKTVISANVFDAQIDYDGTAKKLGSALPELTGKISALANDGTALGRALGASGALGMGGKFNTSFSVAPQNGGLVFPNLRAEIAGQTVTGEFGLASDGKLNADLAFVSLNLKHLLAAGFFPWDGQEPRSDSLFADHVSLITSGEIWLRSQALVTGFGSDLKDAVLGLAFDDQGRSISIASRGADGEPFKLELSLKSKGSSFAASGSGHIGVDLEKTLHLKDGQTIAKGRAIFDGQVFGEGRSLQAVLSTLNGAGTYVLHDAVLTSISPLQFFSSLKTVKSANDLQNAFAVLLIGPGLPLSSEQRAVNIVNGVTNFEPLVVAMADAAVVVAPSYDLNTGDLVADVTMRPKAEANLPAMRVTYAGPVYELVQRNDISALSAKLGYAIITKDLSELDRVQSEQARLSAEEDAQRKADAEKFAAFQAQRGELRLRQRELRVHAAQRLIDVANRKAELDRELAAAAALNKLEITKFKRLLLQ